MPASDDDGRSDSGEDAPPLDRAPRRGRAFCGHERELAALRRWVESLLPACPARYDVILAASELASNAIAHTASGRGGWFAAEITWIERAVRVAVSDGGSISEPLVIDDLEAERGRGLRMIHGLAERTGVEGDCQGRRVWADIRWDGPVPDWPKQMPAQGEADQGPRPLLAAAVADAGQRSRPPRSRPPGSL